MTKVKMMKITLIYSLIASLLCSMQIASASEAQEIAVLRGRVNFSGFVEIDGEPTRVQRLHQNEEIRLILRNPNPAYIIVDLKNGKVALILYKRIRGVKIQLPQVLSDAQIKSIGAHGKAASITEEGYTGIFEGRGYRPERPQRVLSSLNGLGYTISEGVFVREAYNFSNGGRQLAQFGVNEQDTFETVVDAVENFLQQEGWILPEVLF